MNQFRVPKNQKIRNNFESRAIKETEFGKIPTDFRVSFELKRKKKLGNLEQSVFRLKQCRGKVIFIKLFKAYLEKNIYCVINSRPPLYFAAYS